MALLLQEDRVHFSVEEMDEANRRAGWRAEYRQLKPGPFRARLEVQESRDMVATREHVPCGLEVRAEPAEHSVTAIFLRGSGERFRLNGQRATSGRVFVVLPGGDIDVTVGDPTEAFTVTLPDELFSNAAARLGHPSLGERRGTVLGVPGGPRALDALRRSAWVRGPERESRNGHAGLNRGQRIATSLVKLIAHESNRPAARRPDRECLHRARKYIEANLTRPIRIEDICAYAGAGVRTLQRLFQQEFGVSPTRYLQASRLQAARRALLHLDPRRGRVTSIALSYGFNHLGRFSGDYRSYFGEAPSETLGRIAIGSET